MCVSNHRKPKLLENAGKFPYMDHHGYVETSRWIGWNPAYLHIPIGKNLSPLLKVDDFFVIHIGKTPNQISRGKVWVQGTMPKISQVVRPNVSQVSQEKKTGLTFHYILVG